MTMMKVAVRNLFDAYDYDVEFPNDGHGLSVLFAMNGRGKTTIMKMIVAALGEDSDYLSSVPFDFFSVEYDSGFRVDVENGEDGVEFSYYGVSEKPPVPLYMDCCEPVSASEIEELVSVAKKNASEERIDVFNDALRSFFCGWGDKKASFDSEDGLVVSFNGTRPPFELLSSGERKTLKMLLLATFFVPDDGIFLLDSPESSLHVLLQGAIIPTLAGNFIDDGVLGGAYLIVASHSPDVAGCYLKHTVSLRLESEEEDEDASRF